jgi:hypothetical protein
LPSKPQLTDITIEMSKILLFVCLVLFCAVTVLGQTQIRFLNARYYGALTVGVTPDLELVGNTTLTDGVTSAFESPSPVFPASNYMDLPNYEFTVGEEISFYAFNRDNFIEGPIPSEETLASLENVTLVELQSYSLVYVGESEDFGDGVLTPISPGVLFLVEERPNPSPVGKALVRIFNAAVSTYNPATNLTIVVNGTGVASKQISLAFGEASDFLEYDTAASLKLYTALPITGDTTRERIIQFTTVIDSTTVIYIRGDIGTSMQLGDRVNNVEFAFPAAPVAPVAEPMAEGPTAPIAAPTAPVAAPVAAPTRTPTRRVSSAAKAVAQIAGVAGLMSLLF